MKKVLVVGEVRNGAIRKVSFEAIAAATALADGGEIIGLLIGNGFQEIAIDLVEYGADRVILAEHEKLGSYTSDGYGQALMQIISTEQPEAIVFGHTSFGKDLSPKIAAKLDAGLISDVVEITPSEGEIICTRPVYAGKAFEEKQIIEGTSLISIRPNNIAALEKEVGRQGEIHSVKVEVKDLRTIVKEVVRKAVTGVDLTEAKVIISGGRGVKSAEGFTLLQELSDVLGGAVGASRGACDAGYCDYSLQIGQTGKVVTPDLYVACGISGAIQHVAGMSNSKVVVAINKDPEANIFSIADFGIVGDLFEVLPLLIKEFKQILETTEVAVG
ncbi:electron transfer flavoprotein subunit alpha/FixB family protein [Bacillus salipaludis]|uniref:Electron transfer flavoprotein subunit alpha/FixB family protein n=1 Tax=Bacillus salipaludis TaxID=2547811 RepID=A0AA90QUA1_9BACI|nr:electron transfer flavoprotein subunit alpha/FixB family protein [Bacillus salipaludis]MDQ6595073.1 electron transfer flavoprotein subunit alpha/FixB family protein [Bacillus salipaludis]